MNIEIKSFNESHADGIHSVITVDDTITHLSWKREDLEDDYRELLNNPDLAMRHKKASEYIEKIRQQHPIELQREYCEAGDHNCPPVDLYLIGLTRREITICRKCLDIYLDRFWGSTEKIAIFDCSRPIEIE